MLQNEEDDQDALRRKVTTAGSSSATAPERRSSVDQERLNIPPELKEWFGSDGTADNDTADGTESVTESEPESDYNEASVEDDDEILDELRRKAFSGEELPVDSVSLPAMLSTRRETE